MHRVLIFYSVQDGDAPSQSLANMTCAESLERVNISNSKPF